MDVIDVAQEYEERHRDAALQAHRASHHATAGTTTVPFRRDCGTCGDAIPPERLAVQPGATECVPCINRRVLDYGRAE